MKNPFMWKLSNEIKKTDYKWNKLPTSNEKKIIGRNIIHKTLFIWRNLLHVMLTTSKLPKYLIKFDKQ